MTRIMAQLWHPNFNGRVPQYVKNNIPPTFEMFIYIAILSKYRSIMHVHSRKRTTRKLEEFDIFLYCGFTLTHCINCYVNLSRCVYVPTPCTTVIIYLICCFACLCLRIYPLHKNLCMWCLCFRGYPLQKEPIDGSSRIVILLWSSPLVTSKVFASHAMKPLPFL